MDNLAGHLDRLPDDHFPLAIKWEKYQAERSGSQNSLYWVWVRVLCQELQGWGRPTEEQMQAVSYTLIRHCYADKGWPFLMATNKDLLTNEERPAPASITSIRKLDMSMFLEWVQYFAAERGVMLESRGEFKKYKENQHGV